MKYNRKDIIFAWILALRENCYGDNEYNRLQRIKTKYGLIFFESINLTDNGLAIYKQVSNDLKLNRSYF